MTFNKNNFKKPKFYTESLVTFVLFHLLFAVIIQSIFFWFNIGLNFSSLLLPSILWIFFDKYLYGAEDRTKRLFINYFTYIFIFVVFLSYFIQFIEFSFDGNFYHGDTMLQLMYGWNPIKLTGQHLASNGNLWATLYPKFTWIIGGLFIQLTTRSSAGMIINGLIAVITFIKVYSFMKHKSSKLFAFFISIVVVFNPIFIEQMHTFYVDGLIAHLTTILIISNLELMENFNKKSLFQMVMISIILINIKFTSFAFAGLIDLSTFVFYLFKNRKYSLYIVYSGILILVVGLFIGYSPYIVNLLSGRNIFWPLAGKDNWITGDDQVIDAMINLTSLQRFIYSLTYGLFEKNLWDFESKGYLFYDQRIGAMGIHFFKYLVLASGLIPIYLIRDRKKINWSYVLMFVFFTVSIVFNYKIIWKLRYVPHFWLMAPLTIILLRYLVKNKLPTILLISLFLHQTVYMIYYNYQHNFWATNLYRDIYAQYDDGTPYKVRTGDTDFFAVMEEYKMKEYNVNVGEIVFESLPGEECHRVDMYTICFTK